MTLHWGYELLGTGTRDFKRARQAVQQTELHEQPRLLFEFGDYSRADLGLTLLIFINENANITSRIQLSQDGVAA